MSVCCLQCRDPEQGMIHILGRKEEQHDEHLQCYSEGRRVFTDVCLEFSI